ncbi:MAG: sigma-70 family RNA polymerase sigma factor [Deltaproteobacteria bacterium]|nr:sigma-70 family RNA polymerase sigma factor [Deltaproteobacteria bacterium]
MNAKDENLLIRQFKAGDLSIFEILIKKYQDRIYNLCRYLLGHPQDAEDAAQNVFLKAYRNLKHFKPESSLYTWLYRIAVNTCLDHKRKLRPEPLKDESLVEALPSAEPSPEQHYQSKEIGRAIQTALDQLPGDSRAVIVLREIEGLSYEEMAEVLHTSVGTIKSRLSRTREELRRLLPGK